MKTIEKLARSLLILAFILSIPKSTIYSQKGCLNALDCNFGIQLSEVLNGSGHGLLTELDLILKVGQSEFVGGIFTQKDFKQISGADLQYRYFVTSNEGINIYTHYTFMVHLSNPLTQRLNEVFHSEPGYTDYEKFNTFSHQLGFGLQSVIRNNLYFDAKIGFGGYFSFVKGTDTRNNNVLSREDIGFSVLAGFGLVYRFCPKNKKTSYRKKSHR